MDQALRKEMSLTFSEVATQLFEESDRGSVVLAGAWLDEKLTQILKKYLLASKSETLLGPGNPIGDFGVKIELCYRLGLVSKESHRSLKLFRKLRNDAAHLSKGIFFTEGSFGDRVLEFFSLNSDFIDAVLEAAGGIESIGDFISGGAEETPPPEAIMRALGERRVFDIVAAINIAGLSLTLSQIKAVEEF